MAKKTVDRTRQIVKQEWNFGPVHTYHGHPLSYFQEIAERFIARRSVTIQDVRFHFIPDDDGIELVCSAIRPETDEEYQKRIEREEAEIARDKENARKSKAKQEEQDRNALAKLIERYGRDWVETNIK